jgi:hypothetical protein
MSYRSPQPLRDQPLDNVVVALTLPSSTPESLCCITLKTYLSLTILQHVHLTYVLSRTAYNTYAKPEFTVASLKILTKISSFEGFHNENSQQQEGEPLGDN